MPGFSPSTNLGARGAISGVAGLVLALACLDAAAAAPPTAANQKPLADGFVSRTGLPRAWIVSIKPDIVVAIRDRDGLASRTPAAKVRLQGEVTDDDAAERLGYRSMRSAVEVNCETRRDRVVEMEVFSDHNLKGAATKRALPGGWVQPSEDAYMADVIRAVCKGAPPKPDTQIARQDEPAPTGKTKPPIPAPTPALTTPLPKAQAAPKPKSPAPPPVQAPSPTPAPASMPAGALVAQVGSLDSEADAHRLLDGLAGIIKRPLASHIQTAKVGERTYYRAMVSGFASRSDATTFCDAVARKGGHCLVRKTAP